MIAPIRRLLRCFFLFYVPPLFAAQTILPINWLESLGALAGVLALIFALAWILKRTRIGGPNFSQSIRVIATHPLGYKEKILVVKVGEEQLVLGVSSQQITFLCKLENTLSEQTPTACDQPTKVKQKHAQQPLDVSHSSSQSLLGR